jgi:DNA-binding GntR family transcriptional regulator
VCNESANKFDEPNLSEDFVYYRPVAARETKQERVYRALRERIVDGVYGPGYRIVIDGLAAEFGVSALPIREAIRRLEAEGLVIFRPNAGAHVAPVDPAAFHEDMTVLAVLEGYITALASDHITQADLDRLVEINDEMKRAMERLDVLGFGQLNHEFHALIYDRCPNDVLAGAVRNISRRMDANRRTVFLQIPTRGAESVREHGGIIDLLRDHAPHADIERTARNHKLATVASFEEWRRTEGESSPVSAMVASKLRTNGSTAT